MSTQSERARLVGERLNELYPQIDIPLDHKDAYTLLVAVMLSAQCTDKRVNLVTPALFAAADTPQKMAALGQARIKELIATCGLANNKAKAVFEMSKMLIRDYNGEVPDSFQGLESLPGVGHKTASVVMVHQFGVPAFPVDTHIHRLARRWKLTRGKNVVQTETDLKKLFPPEEWELRHLQFITYGREYCTARGCDGTKCPMCRELFFNRKKPGTQVSASPRRELKKTDFETTWGTITLTLDDSGKAVALNLPHLKTAPRKPFEASVSNGWKNASDFFQWLENSVPALEKPEGTEFQQAVWKQLQNIPRGQTRTYGEIAAAIGRPNAVRAVGSACGANPLPLWIPCHRVVAKNGPGGFGSGPPWKNLFLAMEGAVQTGLPAGSDS